MWKRSRARVLLDDALEEEDLRGAPPAGPAAQVQGAGFRGWKEVFSKDDEQHLLERCPPPKTREASLRLKEELKALKQPGRGAPAELSAPPARPDAAAAAAEGRGPARARGDNAPRREDAEQGAAQSRGPAGAGSRWALRSAGRLGPRRRSWQELE